MATAWDRAAAGYMSEWAPRFVPYHLDLLQELTLEPGHRVFIPMCGPGAEVIAVARAIGDQGFIRATDASGEMVRLCSERLRTAGFDTRAEFAGADAGDASGGPWNAIVCAFGLWQLSEKQAVLRAWRAALEPSGKIGILVWGPMEEGQPFELFRECIREIEPSHALPEHHDLARRAAMLELCTQAGLDMVRHGVVRHTLTFRSAELFVSAIRESSSFRRIWETLGDVRFERVARLFYEHVGGPSAPLTFRPPATLVVATQPGAHVDLELRPSTPSFKPPPRT